MKCPAHSWCANARALKPCTNNAWEDGYCRKHHPRLQYERNEKTRKKRQGRDVKIRKLLKGAGLEVPE